MDEKIDPKTAVDGWLPEGKTCKDCGWLRRCEMLGVAMRNYKGTKCDWSPSRFLPGRCDHPKAVTA